MGARFIVPLFVLNQFNLTEGEIRKYAICVIRVRKIL